MPNFLYGTADYIGKKYQTGAGHVCTNELAALETLGDCLVFSAPEVTNEPFIGDEYVAEKIKPYLGEIKLSHFYSGTFSKTVRLLKEHGAKVTYTVCAHDVKDSKDAFEDRGLNYDFPHLTNKVLFQEYTAGYRLSDIIISPSSHSKDVLRKQGCDNTIEVISHGCDLPETIYSLPKEFTVGYLGSVVGPDKGIIYLLKAWKELKFKDSMLILAGKDSTSSYAFDMIRRYGGGNIYLAGWQESIDKFYKNISLFVAPSTTEGFNLEVLESMAHGRLSVCSTGAGASDIAIDVFPPKNIDILSKKLRYYREITNLSEMGIKARERAKDYTWEKIKKFYLNLWKKLLNMEVLKEP